MSEDYPLPGESRYVEISRRAFLRRGAALGIAVAIPSSLLAACSNSDAELLGEGAADATAGGTSTTTLEPTTTTKAATTTTTTTHAQSTTTEAALGTFPAGSEFIIDFTYAADSATGSVKNPYVAVWVEDESGDLVATIALWFLQSRKGLRWLNDLRRWATVDGSDETVDEISSSTRRPGDYSVVWDGRDIDGNLIAPGNYYVAIEASREHGPYSLIREEITIGAEEFSQPLESEGELENAMVSLVVA